MAVASMHPDNMIQPGLADDFQGEITKVRTCRWDYGGNLDHDILAVAVDITPDEDSGYDPFTQHYSAGDLDHFAPSMDGKKPSDEGVYALQVGKRENLAANTNWAHFVGAALEAEFPAEKLEADVSCFEGVRGHFNRVTQKKRGFQDEGKARSILVLTQVESVGEKKGKTTTEEIDGPLSEMIVGILSEEGLIGKQKLPGYVVKHFKGADKPIALKRVADLGFLSSNPESWIFDPEDGTLVAV